MQDKKKIYVYADPSSACDVRTRVCKEKLDDVPFYVTQVDEYEFCVSKSRKGWEDVRTD